ncbi:hypothetical protein [Aeoliella mucimassa]|uniref:Uncharacterized protein n=1 Tax=Aeoliella mucimassa TaxID=2527972 RepID=A0A518AUZ4_9BACT|nr:hypothetical protein [Aeoliella mucimassa]QDU58547.1 hypothetical protein Pan181_47850 [Aeoliella mucimassa]
MPVASGRWCRFEPFEKSQPSGGSSIKANRWLFLLVAEKVLALVEKGDRLRRRASRFRYLGEL